MIKKQAIFNFNHFWLHSKEGTTMSDIDLIKVSYEAARGEINVRLRIRSQTLAFYLAASGALLGFIAKGGAPNGVVVLIALFALAGCLMITHHNACIAQASLFCGTELKAKFNGIPMWNNCATNERESFWRRQLRFYSQMLILLFPPILAFIFQFSRIDNMSLYEFMSTTINLWASGIILLIFIILFVSKHYRKKMFAKSSDYSISE
jgi:hypothetical protein